MPPLESIPLETFPGKAEARAWARALLKDTCSRDRTARSAEASARVLTLESFQACDLVLAFLSMPSEIDTSRVIRAAFKAGKRVAAPRMEGGEIVFAYLNDSWESLPRDALGIPTPPEGELIFPEDLRGRGVFALIPGLLFDPCGGRLGRGKGYYDRFLTLVLSSLGSVVSGRPGSSAGAEALPGASEHGLGFFVPCGFCFDAQVVPKVPRTARDVRIPLIVTEARLLDALPR